MQAATSDAQSRSYHPERNVMNELSILNESAIQAELTHRREVLSVAATRRNRRIRRAAR
jgi:hypothetical protein